MEEITHIDHRATVSVHETDRTSSGLLAQVYQHLAKAQTPENGVGDRVQTGVTMTTKPAILQEAKT